MFNAVHRLAALTALLAVLTPVPAAAGAIEVRAAAANIERGFAPDAEIDGVAEVLGAVEGAELWAFAELSEADPDAIERILGDGFEVVLGNEGSDYVAVAYDTATFTRLERVDLPLTHDRRYRRHPLALKLRHADGGPAFWFVAVHLLRGDGDDPERADEAADLRAWIEGAEAPAVVMGDFNLDYSVEDETFESEAADPLRRGGVLEWVRPEPLTRTYCGRYNSILDFAFLAHGARGWTSSSKVVQTSCEDGERLPDHRPIVLDLELPAGA